MQSFRFAHLVIGIVGLIAFALSGQYMHWVLAHLQGMPDGPRMLYRSSHIYLLWSSLLNVLLGCYLVRQSTPKLRLVQALASLAIVVGPNLLVVSFFIESNNASLIRPFARAAVYLALFGTLALAGCSYVSRAKPNTSLERTRDR